MVIQQSPSGGAALAQIAESLGHVAEHGPLPSSRITHGLLGPAGGSPGHGVQVTGLQEGFAGGLEVAGGGKSLTQAESRDRASRGHRHGLPKRLDRGLPNRLDHVGMPRGLRGKRHLDGHQTAGRRIGRGLQQPLELRLLRFGELAQVILAQRTHARLVAGRGAHDGRHASRLRLREHALHVQAQVPCRGLAQRRIGRNEGLPDHLLHERAALVGATMQETLDCLHQRQPARRAHERQGPGGRGARRVDGRGAVGPEELVVAHVEHHQVGAEPQRLPHLVDQRETRHRRGAQVDHLHLPIGPCILQHGLQERAHGQVGWLRIALRRRFAHQEDAHRAGRLGHGEGAGLRVARTGRVGEEVGLEGAVLHQTERAATRQRSHLADEGRIAAPAEEPKDHFHHAQQQQGQAEGDQREDHAFPARQRRGRRGVGDLLAHG